MPSCTRSRPLAPSLLARARLDLNLRVRLEAFHIIPKGSGFTGAFFVTESRRVPALDVKQAAFDLADDEKSEVPDQHALFPTRYI